MTTHPAASVSGRASVLQRTAHAPGRRVLTVRRVEELSPTMRRVVLAGSDLEAGFPFLPLAVADHVKVVLPDEDTGALVMPEPGPPGLARPDGRPAVTRDYTVRAYDRSAGELTLDFVLHPHGPAGRWGSTAAPGATLGVMGPRSSEVFPAHLDHYLLVADETGLPALERFLEELPPTTRVQALLLTADGAPRPMPDRESAELVWHRLGDLGQAASWLLEAVEGWVCTADSFVWGAGEASIMRALRTRLRRHPALDVGRVAVRGYWRVGATGAVAD